MFVVLLMLVVNFFSFQTATAGESTCPTSQAAITAWRDSAFQSLLSGDYARVLSDVRECFGNELPECLKDLRYYAESLRGPKLTQAQIEELYDKNLIDRTEAVLPEEFWAKDASGKRREGYVQIPPDLFDLAKKKGWKVEPFKTRDRGGFNDSHNLLLMTIPGKDKDVVMMATLDENANPRQDIVDPEPKPSSGNFTKGHDTMTMIIVYKDQNSASKRSRMKRPPVAQMRRLYLDKDKKHFQWVNTGRGTFTCNNCHTMPTRAISPVGYKVQNGDEKPMSLSKLQSIADINEMLAAPTSWGSAMLNGREVRFGPPIDSQPIGWAPKDSPTRTQAFIEQCAAERESVHHYSRDAALYQHSISAKKNAPIRWEMVRNAMNCIECHDGSLRGVIPSTFSHETLAFKVAIDKSMPAGPDKFDLTPPNLTDDERLAVLSCLKKETSAVAKAWSQSGWWVKRVQCEDTAKPKPESHNVNIVR